MNSLNGICRLGADDMTTWSVTIRNKKGGLETFTLQAPNRTAVFAEMRAKGLSVVRIDEAAERNDRLRIDGAAAARWLKRLAACVVAIGAVAAAAIWYFRVDVRNLNLKPGGRVSVTVSGKTPPPPSAKTDAGEQVKPKSAKAVASEFREKARPFVKKAVTNAVEWIVPPLDPDDPDNAMRTAVAQDIGSLLSIVPGEDVPPIIPFGFMFEDEDDESEGKSDGGNAAFLESLKKWKLTVKSTDSETTAEAKKNLAEAQMELLRNMGEGLSVNDSIRAAYDFRVRAAATRNSFIDAIKGVYEQDGNADLARKVMKDMNKRLAEEGILEISEADILPDLDDDGGADGGVQPEN